MLGFFNTECASFKARHFTAFPLKWTHAIVLQALSLSLCHQPEKQLVDVLSSADVAQRLMLILKRDKRQFVVKT
jgi:hypothetical protein